jgi:hypothetical protein
MKPTLRLFITHLSVKKTISKDLYLIKKKKIKLKNTKMVLTILNKTATNHKNILTATVTN